jgi:hypothetical protein
VTETEFDLNALPEQLLLGQALTLVAHFCKSRPAAERLLHQHLDRFYHPSIRWKYSSLCLPQGCSGAAMRFVFWRPGDDARLEVDWDAHSAVYIGPIPTRVGVAPDEPEDRWPIFQAGNPPGRVEAQLIRLHRDDVIAVLRYHGLLLAAAPIMGRRSQPPAKPTRERGAPGVGHPADYEADKIRQIAETYFKDKGLPATYVLFKEKVADACKAARVKVPQDTQYRAIIGPWSAWKKRAETCLKRGKAEKR